MYFTGFADEAAKNIDGQIAATKELGWGDIEARSISSVNIHDISEAEFDTVCGKLADADVKVNCFGSTIANWTEQITDPFEISLKKTKRAISRMQRLGTKLVRIMSYALIKGQPPEAQMEQERFRRLRELKRIFDDAGITPVHENCMNYGGLSLQHTLKLIENVPGLRLVFDTGNPVFTDDRSKPEPYPKQSSWEFYKAVKEHISYIHIKDAVWDSEKKQEVYRYCGEGDGDVHRILNDLLAGGYDGGISIEPHLIAVFHDDSKNADEMEMRHTYTEYGRRLETIVAKILD
ncbi:MAG: sugar phosphate isomerase/epimerase family protein [Planctomycetota bacterium]|jgi:sugar phosphate isomerase/epimerase